jgi:hypothetical protein
LFGSEIVFTFAHQKTSDMNYGLHNSNFAKGMMHVMSMSMMVMRSRGNRM